MRPHIRAVSGWLLLLAAPLLAGCASAGHGDEGASDLNHWVDLAVPIDAAQAGDAAQALDAAQPLDAAPLDAALLDAAQAGDAARPVDASAPLDRSPACAADQCDIGGACVAGGTPNPSDPCEACLPSLRADTWSTDAANTTCDGLPYFTGVTRSLAHTPYGHTVGISCHNCYVASDGSALADTLAKIHQAQADGADLIELDVREQGGVAYVEHDDGASVHGARLADVLADTQLRAGDQLLYIELKETTPTDAFLASVLDALVAGGYGTTGRPVALRAFDDVSSNLLVARKLLARPAYAALRPHVRLHVLYDRADGNDIASLQAQVRQARQRGLNGVEFDYQTPNLFGAVAYARSLDLGVNLWTLPASNGEVYVATLRDEADVLTCDYPVAKARAVAQAPNGLVYLSAADQSALAGHVEWHKADATPQSAPVGGAGQPTLSSLTEGQSLYGTVLGFDGTQQQYLPFYNAQNDAAAGYLVSVVARFDRLVPTDNATAVLLGKADAASFSLELYGTSAADTVLRFGVAVGGQYRYATFPASALDTEQSYLITGAYDGNGSVWLWVNNSAAQTTLAGPFTGGVTQNQSRVLLGADPQDKSTPAGQEMYFSGQVQMALVQRWADH